MHKYGILIFGILIGGLLTFTALKYSERPPIAQPQIQQNDSVASSLENQLSPDISEKQDENFVYVAVKLDDPQGLEVNARVNDGYIKIDGKEKKKIARKNGELNYESEFHRSFPVPDGVDARKMEKRNENGKLVLKFPKTRS